MARNIELKARLRDPAAARAVALRLAPPSPEVELQIDTYFVVPHGRLKLREIEGRTARLIRYARDDAAVARASDYRLVDVVDAPGLKEALSSALGIRAVVKKRREIRLVDDVRIHLDEVDGLGSFLELETVLNARHDDDDGHRRVARLVREFGIVDADLESRSYGDLILGI